MDRHIHEITIISRKTVVVFNGRIQWSCVSFLIVSILKFHSSVFPLILLNKSFLSFGNSRSIIADRYEPKGEKQAPEIGKNISWEYTYLMMKCSIETIHYITITSMSNEKEMHVTKKKN